MTSTVRTPQQKRSIEKKRRIIEAASELIGQKGLAGTTIKDIATGAGVAVGTFYSYFKDKDDLLLDLLSWHKGDLEETIFERFHQLDLESMTGREICRWFVEASYKSHIYSAEMHRQALALRLMDEGARVLAIQTEQYVLRQTVRIFQSLKGRLRITDLEAAARVISAAMEEVVHSECFFDQTVERERTFGELADMLCRYLFTNPDA
ncbi:TetR/AcrR family transcriptional regulator [Salidesulfovibrio onnuriiensis]|uniref:TetR/AcrR family transcriptional regulator n=1 Tax=Salidesulfovibrio onnuriiensis TaxID=2583823 RepID=UPI0011CA756B|nr:TetR/AcrR family transcriptional regulator [Salidesulfovibrio onnuriiensis]